MCEQYHSLNLCYRLVSNLVKASIQAARAITGVYFQKLITTGAKIGGTLLALIWALVIWLTTAVDPLWGMFFLLLVPLTVVSFIIYGLMLRLGKELIPRPLSKTEQKKVGELGDKVFQLTESVKTPWPYHLVIIGKDVLRGKESMYIKEVIANTGSLKDDFLNIRQLFNQ